MAKYRSVATFSRFTEYDIFLFKSGKHFRLFEKLGSHVAEFESKAGLYFAVYAPAAEEVSVIGDFNHWDATKHVLFARWDDSGIWEGFIAGVEPDILYKYSIKAKNEDKRLEKADPFARYAELRPKSASIVWSDDYVWNDTAWMAKRKNKNSLEAPLAVYELHLGSWKWHSNHERPLTYRELAPALIEYLQAMQFTHVELMPIMEFPYDPSWGYQITGYFAPTSRFGTPEDFKFLIDELHNADIGIIVDWVPSHFPNDGHGLSLFDGSHVYEHPDPRRGYHPDWQSMIFNYGRPEIVSFLISNALFWLDQYHIDGLRVDAVASMLYLDYSRDEGGWEPNIHGGNQNLEAIDFLQSFNTAVKNEFPDVLTIAEESTSYEGVTRAVEDGGLGFDLKWMMGWMHDTLKYFKEDSLFRSHHHQTITFSAYYAFSEHFMLPFSHDEVVHGKASLLGRMPGDEWTRFANLRAMYAYMYTHPGAKLLFMGAELGQYSEWAFDAPLDWNLLDYPVHQGIQRLVSALNVLFRTEPALYEKNYESQGFEWIDYQDSKNSVISFVRRGKRRSDQLVVVCNFTPVIKENYSIGVPSKKTWQIIFNSDDTEFGGSGYLAQLQFKPANKSRHGKKSSVNLVLPPLSVLVLSTNT